MKKLMILALVSLLSPAILAKLPAQSDEAKAAEAAAKAAWAGKVDAYQLCKAQDKVAAQYSKTAKPAVKGAKPAATTCVDPGPFSYTPVVATAPAAAAVPAAVPAPAAASPKKP